MRQFIAVVPPDAGVNAREAPGAEIPVLPLTYHQRRRSRLGLTLSSGEDVGIALPRGEVLSHGDLLRDEAGGLIRVEAAAETVSVVRTTDPHLLARAAYHLGNRHVPLQIAPGELAYLHDHVLDGMVKALGLLAVSEQRPFEAEPGPYGQAGRGDGGHGHGHGHGHDHPHEGHVHEDEASLPPLFAPVLRGRR